MTMRVGIVVPTYNAGDLWREVVAAIKFQNYPITDVIIIDSSSRDNTCDIAKEAGFKVYSIDKKNFNHGTTRQDALNYLSNTDIAIYLTQDAVLKENNAINSILNAFEEPKVGAAYGRQVPRNNANSIEAHARLFNYPEKSLVKSFSDRNIFGIKTIQLSNSFAAYRLSALKEVGGFPKNVIACEDVYVSAKLLLSNWKVAYCAGAEVYHSHNYSIWEEFKRYFDVGTFYGQERWLEEKFGGAKNEGLKFVKSEITYLFNNSPWLLPEMAIRTFMKLVGYHLGMNEKLLPLFMKRLFSSNKNYWNISA